MATVWQITWSENEDIARNVNMMNRTQDILRASKPPASRTLPDLESKETEIPEFPGCAGTPSVYSAEILLRAETVTPVLKGIPGYLLGHVKN
jgi:hypothetical protein